MPIDDLTALGDAGNLIATHSWIYRGTKGAFQET